MATLMERGLAMLATAAPAAAGGSVVYSDGTNTVTVDATFGKSEFVVNDADGQRVEYSDRDIIVEASLLVLAGIVRRPVRGHTFTIGTEVFEVLAPGGADVWRACDPMGTVIRIHGRKKP